MILICGIARTIRVAHIKAKRKLAKIPAIIAKRRFKQFRADSMLAALAAGLEIQSCT
jgi:hypothetical protein